MGGTLSLYSVLLLLLVNFVSVQLGNNVHIPHRKYKVIFHSFPWFSFAYTAGIVYRNHFFCLLQQNKSSESKVQTG